MRSYVLVSMVVFDFIAVAQLVRFFMGWPVVVAGFSVPVWASAVAAVAIGSLAVWGFRLTMTSRPASAGA